MEKMTTYGYGPHLTLDLGDCDVTILNDLNICFAFLNELPSRIGMNKITQPYVFRYDETTPEECGVTGFVVIAESHISLHTYPEKKFVFVDVFSCKPFDIKEAEKYIVSFFGSKSPVVQKISRGEKFPQ